MWIAKFMHRHMDCVIGSRTRKFNCTAYEYLINHYRKGKKLFFTNLNIISGKDTDKKSFIKDIKKERRIHNLEINNDFILLTYVEGTDKEFYEYIFNPQIFYLKPILIDEQGWEHYEIASWNKKPLMEFINASKQHFEFKLQNIEESKKKEFFIPHALPKLSSKQKQAFDLAVREGYYDFPRNTDLSKLGEIMGISRQTYQQHLRFAEKKLMPFLAKTKV